MKLKNSHAIITGGASGLGAATASKVIDRGGKVTIIDLDEQRAAATVEKLGPHNSHSWAKHGTAEHTQGAAKKSSNHNFAGYSCLT